MKPVKIALIVIGALVAIFVLLITYITLIIDPNDYKPEIIEQVKINTGRDMVIEGDISWSFLPDIGLTIGHTELKNPRGFPTEPLLQFDHAQVNLAFWPLLSKEIEVGMISIDGFSVYLHTRKDGKSNLDGIGKSSEQDGTLSIDSEQPTPEQTAGAGIEKLAIKGIEINNAKILIENVPEQTKQIFDSINFTLGELQLEKSVPISFSAKIDTGELKANIHSEGKIKIAKALQRFDLINLKTEVIAEGEVLPNKQIIVKNHITGFFDQSNQLLRVPSFKLSVFDIDINGELSVKLNDIPDIQYDFKIGKVDLDAIFPPKNKETEEPEEQTVAQSPDLSWMKNFNVKGLVSIESIKSNKLTISNISLPLELKQAQLNLNPVKADLYEGNILAKINLDARKKIPTYAFKASMNEVKALPLVKDLLEKELISGTANFSADLKGKGLDVDSIKQNILGNGQFAFTDGAVHGINVAELLRTAYAKLKGQTIEPGQGPKQTDFASLTGSFSLLSGIVKNPDLELLSPLLRISGKGQAQIINETVDYYLTTSIVGTLKGQGGEPIKDLKNLSVPLKIKGPMAQPKISVDMDAVFKQQLKSKTDEQKKKLKDKLKNKLKGLFD